MALSENRIVYGIHSIAPFSRVTGLPFGILKVIGGGSLSLSTETEKLFGGSNKNPWASEAKTTEATFTSTVKSMPDFLFELFLGASVSTTAASATGTVGTITNVVGTSAVSATVGIASVDLATSADLKTGRYRVEVTSATDVAVYLLTDIDIKRGTDAEYQNDVLKITVADLTIPSTSGTIAIPNTGLEFTGGSGTVAMTVGDVAEFDIARPHGGISDITIGESSATFPEHSQLCLSAARSDGSIFEIEIHKAVASGFPIGLEETVFSIPELTVDLLYDSTKDALAKVRAVAGE